jgi:rhomboid protease GluP
VPNSVPAPPATPAPRRPPLVPPGWLDQAPVTRALLSLNVALFVVQLVLTAGKSAVHLPTREALAFGASYSLAIVGENRWETLVTACFLHDGFLHLALTMAILFLAGPTVETMVGSARMAPMYLVAGAAGNLSSVAATWLQRSAQFTVGASGAVCGVLAAAFVVGWRTHGWKAPLTQAMLRWLAFLLIFTVLARFAGGHSDNAAHFGGAVAAGLIAAAWNRSYKYTELATRITLGACATLLVACIGVVAWRDHTDPYATYTLQERDELTNAALDDGRCRDAHDGLHAVERLRGTLAPVNQLREKVELVCGHVGPP